MSASVDRSEKYGRMSLDLTSQPRLAEQLRAYRTERGLTETAAVRILVAAALRARAPDAADQTP
jgi:hypothetical protein